MRTRGTMDWPGRWHKPEAANLLIPFDSVWRAFFADAPELLKPSVRRSGLAVFFVAIFLIDRAKDLRLLVVPGAEPSGAARVGCYWWVLAVSAVL